MNIVADENVDAAIVAALRRDGHAVFCVAEEAGGISDEQVLNHAAAAGALLITADKDFGELVIFRGGISSGVLLLRLAGTPPTEKASLVVQAVASHGEEMAGGFSVLSKSLLRIRPPRHLLND